jgi:4'-phosphopantetheinyl transferase
VDGEASFARRGEVHVWIARLRGDAAPTAGAVGLLDAGERARAGQFRFQEDRCRFVQSHAIVRRILAAYLDADPSGLTFRYGPHGKPFLAGPASKSRLHFSLSHSANCCMLAVRRDWPLGLDVEQTRHLPGVDAIARRHFAPRESAIISRLRGSARRDAFFALWTRKEAIVKALGESLAHDRGRLPLELDAAGNVRLASRDGDESITGRWSVVRLRDLPGYVGVVAGCPPFAGIECFDWQESAGPLRRTGRRRLLSAEIARTPFAKASFAGRHDRPASLDRRTFGDCPVRVEAGSLRDTSRSVRPCRNYSSDEEGEQPWQRTQAISSQASSKSTTTGSRRRSSSS